MSDKIPDEIRKRIEDITDIEVLKARGYMRSELATIRLWAIDVCQAFYRDMCAGEPEYYAREDELRALQEGLLDHIRLHRAASPGRVRLVEVGE